jgi:hypothetical protein
MESLLLGGLSYYGNNISKNKQYKQNTDVYTSNMENNMNKIEQKQANPDFYQQFDSLRFDNISKPTGENQSYMTKSGFNHFLQRDLDFQNGYSEFQDTDMHYGVVPREEFTHNNMQPNTSRRDTLINLDSNNRKFESLSGNNSNWNHKREIETFFEPVKDMSNVYGLPVVAGELTNRYIASYKNNNGALPFDSDVKVLPGLDGKTSAPYAVTRVMPRNVDELRSEINKKVTYLNKPLETIKKGELRAEGGKITNFKLPSYREITTDDLVANKHYVGGQKQTGDFAHLDTLRGLEDYDYMGGAYNPTRGNNPDVKSIYFNPAKRENYENDFTHAINAVNSRPVFTNAKSYTNYETDRSQISKEVRATGAYNTTSSTYYHDKNNEAKPTMKQNNIVQDRNLGVTDAIEKKSYMFSNDLVLPVTNRQTTQFTEVMNPTPSFQNTHLTLPDTAKQTIKETTIDKQYIGNANPSFQNIHTGYTDKAKLTIKETTVDKPFVANTATSYQNIHLNYTDKAKTTVRQTTVDKPFVANTAPTFTGYVVHNGDGARTTVRQTTENNNYIGIAGGDNKDTYTAYDDEAKTTIRQTTLSATPVQNVVANVPASYGKNDEEARTTIKETTLHATPGGRMGDSNQGYYNINDEARITIKETTLLSNYKGHATSAVEAIRVEEAERNMCIDDKKTQTALGGRPAGAKSDKIRGDINRDTVKFNNKRQLYGYISNPGTSNNYSVTPFENTHTDKKNNLNNNNFYHIDPIYVQTLNNNPLVNDIRHQKNVDFSTGY